MAWPRWWPELDPPSARDRVDGAIVALRHLSLASRAPFTVGDAPGVSLPLALPGAWPLVCAMRCGFEITLPGELPQAISVGDEYRVEFGKVSILVAATRPSRA